MEVRYASQREIDRTLSGAVKLGLTIRRYRTNPDGSIEVELADPQQTDALPASLIDWSRPK